MLVRQRDKRPRKVFTFAVARYHESRILTGWDLEMVSALSGLTGLGHQTHAATSPQSSENQQISSVKLFSIDLI